MTGVAPFRSSPWNAPRATSAPVRIAYPMSENFPESGTRPTILGRAAMIFSARNRCSAASRDRFPPARAERSNAWAAIPRNPFRIAAFPIARYRWPRTSGSSSFSAAPRSAERSVAPSMSDSRSADSLGDACGSAAAATARR